MPTCRAFREGDRLILETPRLRRTYLWNAGHLRHLELLDRATGCAWTAPEPPTTLDLCDERPSAADGCLESQWITRGPVRPDHLKVTITCRLGNLAVRREFEVFDEAPAIRCTYFLRGGPASVAWRSAAAGEGTLANIESVDHAGSSPLVAPVMDRVTFAPRHLHATAVQFFDITDRRNSLVAHRHVTAYTSPVRLRGNLLLVRDAGGGGLFLLKEAPCSDTQLADAGFDFSVRRGEVQCVGLGTDPADVTADQWVRCYGVVIGVGGPDRADLLRSLRAYQDTLRRLLPGRDQMIVLNTWGDRSQDRHVGEAFALTEIDSAARLGLTHFQLDDGWQKGRSSNSAHGGGFLQRIWERDDAYWSVDPDRFPRGLEPVLDRARQRGVELCLWYNPSRDDGYGHWQRDADQLLALHQRYGIRVFKIDGIDIPNKHSEANLRRMFDKVHHESGGAVVFNLDVTAMRRFGYHYFAEYGNLFLENRYTDWGNYYPHWTLRNLWQLAHYVPAQRMQIEFLNIWRNADRYPADDPLAPGNLSMDYCFAIAMFAQPLAWFECANLPERAYAQLAPLVAIYRRHVGEIHAGQVFPIGEEPSGWSWTGLESVGREGGYALVLREGAGADHAVIPLQGGGARGLDLELIAGDGAAEPGDDAGAIRFHLAKPFSFALFRYH